MEHRYESRKRIDLSVHLSLFGKELGRFRALNAGNNGLYLEGKFELKKYCVVNLRICVESETFSVQAMVIHNDGHGIGLLAVAPQDGFVPFLAAARYRTPASDSSTLPSRRYQGTASVAKLGF